MVKAMNHKYFLLNGLGVFKSEKEKYLNSDRGLVSQSNYTGMC